MLSSLINLLNNYALRPETRKVERYLNDSTCDSISADLGKLFSQELRHSDFLQKTFDQHCVEDSSHQKHWTEESFRKHIRSTHAASAISDDAIQLLWRSFHFYAYHPFPRHLEDAKIDWDAFRRAVLLNVFQCDGFLGTRELDWFWRNDASFFRKASFSRIFRSIAAPDDMTWAESSKQQSDINSSLSDAMDALVMVGPQFIHAIPTQAYFEGVARKLFAEGPVVARRPVRREEVSILMSLLLRLRLQKEKWSSCHIGSVLDASSAYEGLTKAFVDSLAEHDNKATMEPEQLLRAIDLMPNFLLRFQQLWAVLFQPPGATVKKLSAASEKRAAPITGALSLFTPFIKIPNSYHERINQDTRIMLREVQPSSDSYDMTISRLGRDLSSQSIGYVVLFTTDASATAPKQVVGAYFPSPSQMHSSHAAYEKPDPLSNSLHLLFELEPRFGILRWTKSKAMPSDVIRTEAQGTLGQVQMEGCPESAIMPYYFGDPSLKVDPGNQKVLLANAGGEFYKDMRTGETVEIGLNYTTLQNPRMDVYKVVSAGDRNR